MGGFELHEVTKAWQAGERPKLVNAMSEDNADMRRMGKKQQFRRNFKVVAITSFSVVTMMGWVFIPVNAPLVIEVAGTGGVIVIFLANFFGFLITVLSLAEMSSIAPTAGGQYHWTSEFAPPKYQRFLSYISGWLASISWLVAVSSGVFIAGNLVPVLISLVHPDFVPTAWQGYLFVVAMSIIAFLINGFLAQHLPLLEGFVLCFTVMTFISIVIVMLALSHKLTASEVFQTFPTNVGSLTSAGILEIIASQVLMMFSMLSFDSTAHMAEETEHAAVVIPRAMVWSYCVNGLLDFIILIVVCFCYIAPDAYATKIPGYPFLELFVTATGSVTGAVAITSMLIVLIMLSQMNFVASTSRQVFAFARDEGLPFSSWIAKVNDRMLTPINSLIVVTMFVVLICLIGLGSAVAFNAIISLNVMAMASTYQVSLMSLIWRRLYGDPLPPAPWSLGKWGLPINIFSVMYGWYLLAFAAMPGAYPVTAANMNWAPVMFGGALIFSLAYYFLWARKVYEGPVVKTLKEY